MMNILKKVTCKVCGKEFQEITAMHLKKHDMTRREYIEKFGMEGVQGAIIKMITPKEVLDVVDIYAIDRHGKIQKRTNK